MRYIDTPAGIERPRWRSTLSYRVLPKLQIGIEVNAAVGEVDPIANLFVLTETDRRPAVILGTSSDRIGTPKGKQAFFVTAAKQIGNFPVAPYISLSYSQTGQRFVVPFGANIQLGKQWMLLPMYDGHASHTLLTYMQGNASVQLIAAWNRRFGMSFGYHF